MKIPKVKTKHLLSVTDFSKEEILEIFKYTLKLKNLLKNGKRHDVLRRKSLAMIFEKSSTRTRVSFETGITQLGGHGLFLSSDDIQLGRGETIPDTARVLSRYVQGAMIRTFSHDTVVEFARYSSVPIINGLTDSFHPCQALTDYFTIFEREKKFENAKLTYVGDGNNVANSLLLTAAILGMNIAIVTPKKYGISSTIVEMAEAHALHSGAHILFTDKVDDAVPDSHYLYTDVWVSMGQEKERARRKRAFGKYKITKKMLEKCHPECKVMHCLPAYRGQEIDEDVLESNRAIIFDQAENRLHLQKAVMAILMNK